MNGGRKLLEPKEKRMRYPHDDHEGEDVLLETARIMVGVTVAFFIFIIFRYLIFNY